MRARALIVLAVVATLALPLGASADPKPAGCGGIVQVTGNSCTFVLEAGNNGDVSIGLAHLASGATTARIDILRGNTVVYSTGPITDDFGVIKFGGDIGSNTAFPGGTYRCRVTTTGPVIVTAYGCVLA